MKRKIAPFYKLLTAAIAFAFAFTATTAMAYGEESQPAIPLFDGKTLDGWDYDPAIWRIEDGMIVGGSTSEKIKANYYIFTKVNYQNFDLSLKIRCSGDKKTGLINSGIQIRSMRFPEKPTHVVGYQVDCGEGYFGKIYDESRRGNIADPVDADALKKVVDILGWNTYRILAEGPRIRVWINDVLATDFTETNPKIPYDGHVGVQVHSGGVALVQFKDMTIKALPATDGAPTWESLGGVKAATEAVKPPRKKNPPGEK
jgi:hypothetical protein